LSERDRSSATSQMKKPMGLVFEESSGQDKCIVRAPPGASCACAA
jgi:hypothetical protein